MWHQKLGGKLEMTGNDAPVLVLGGTGHYGRHVVGSLLAKGTPVRVLSRNAGTARKVLGVGEPGADSAGDGDARIEIVEGDIRSWTSVVAALAATRGVVIAVSAFSPKAIRHLKEIERDAVLMVLEEAEKAEVARVVFLSVYDLRQAVIEELGSETAQYKLEVERALRQKQLNWTVLGAGPSMDIFFAFIRGKRMMVPGGGQAALPAVSAVDVGEITAQAVLRDDLGGQRIRMVGPEAITFPDAAQRISAVTGREIRLTKIPLLPLRIASLVTAPVNPFLRHVYPYAKLMNSFPADITDTAQQDHKRLLELFDYVPTTLEMEVERRKIPSK
jgi:uncharacterized protein YbjT (DUF2867 family)